MTATFHIQAKAIGRRKAIIPDWAIPIPPDWHKDGRRPTLRDLITKVVLEEVENFQTRQDERRFVRVLTERQIEEGVEAGKIDPGERDLRQSVDPDAAVDAAMTAFIDGLYFVFIDEVQALATSAGGLANPGAWNGFEDKKIKVVIHRDGIDP